MELVGRTLTDIDGVAHFKCLVLNVDPQYQYYLFVNSPFMGSYNYSMNAPVMIDFKTLISPPSTTPNYINTFDRLAEMHSARDFNKDSKLFTYTQSLLPKSPSIKMILQEKDGFRRIVDPKTVVLVKEEYVNNKDWPCSGSDGNQVTSPPCPDKEQYLPMAMADTGVYAINGLMVQADFNTGKVVGPKRSIYITCPGFDDQTVDVGQAGEQYSLTVTLKYGATLSGTIIDKDTKKPIPNASVEIIGNSKSGLTNSQGYYSIETRLLHIKKRVVFSAEGYNSDTVDIYIDKAEKKGDHTMFKHLRRLSVKIWDMKSGKGLPGMIVTLPNVKVPQGSHVDYIFPSSLNSITMNSSQAASMINTSGGVSLEQSGSGKTEKKPLINSPMTSKPTMADLAQGNNKNKVIDNGSGGTSSSGSEISYSEMTDADGYANFSFISGSGDMFRVIVSNPESNPVNYPTIMVDANVPFAKYPTEVIVNTMEGSCLSGTVYIGDSNSAPAEGAEARATIYGQAEEYTISAFTGKDGKFTLKNLRHPLMQKVAPSPWKLSNQVA
jgi:hypothetical protein